MVHYHNIEQGSPEWDLIRLDKLTGSHATEIAANGAGLKTYCKSIALAIIGAKIENYTNATMDRGTNLEPIGKMAYELQTNTTINNIGFITNDLYPKVGISPDGLIGDIGGVEMKARNNIKHFSLILGETPEIPFNQIQMTLLITERKWWDFISFNPELSKPLFIKRILPDLAYHEKLKIGFIEGDRLIKEYIEKYNKY